MILIFKKLARNNFGTYCKQSSLFRYLTKRPSFARLFYNRFRAGQTSVAQVSVANFCRQVSTMQVEAVLKLWISQLYLLPSSMCSTTFILTIEKAARGKVQKCLCSYSTEAPIANIEQKISKTSTAFAEAAIHALLAKLVTPCIFFDSRRTWVLYWASMNNNQHLVRSRTFNCMIKVLSATKLVWTLRCGTDINNWMLRISLSFIFIWHTLTLPSATICISQYKKSRPGCTVRSAETQTASMVSVPSVLDGNCAWRNTPRFPATNVTEV